jgi:transposase InsO family protein
MFFFTPEAFFGSFERDYVYQARLETLEEVRRQGPAWIGPYNQEAPHSAFGMQLPAEFYAAWLVTSEQQPVKN